MADCSGFYPVSTIHWHRKNGQIHNPPLTLPDGEFTIDPHPGTAVFTGQHRDAQGNLTVFTNTQCVDTGPNKFRIRMHRLDLTVRPPEQFIYTGDGVVDPVTGGVTITGDVHVPGHPEGGDTGTWETSRPGGGDDDDDDDDEAEDENEDNGGDVSNKRAR